MVPATNSLCYKWTQREKIITQQHNTDPHIRQYKAWGTACESKYLHSCRIREVWMTTFLGCPHGLTASSGCLLSLKKYKVPSIHFLQCSLRSPEALLPAAVWVVCYTSESLIEALSFRHLMGGDSKVLLLQSPFLWSIEVPSTCL